MRPNASGWRAPLAAFACALSAFGTAPRAFAQSAADSAAAQALFEQGRTLLTQGRAAEACPKLEESQRLDPGSGTLINLARCYEQLGRFASAWNKYLEAAAAANATGNALRAKEARERSEALRPRLSNLVIDVSADGRNIAGLEVRRDGDLVGAPQWGVPIPADVGKHSVVASAPGYEEWHESVSVEGPAKSVTVEVPALKPKASAPVSVADVSSDSPEAGGGLGTQRTLALVAGGVGVVGIGLGTVFGLSSMSKHDEAEKYCSGADCTNPRGVSAGEDAYAAGTLSTVCMVIGGVALAGGATLWFTAPSTESRASAALGVGPGSLLVRGVF